ncbi:hypothetical protein H3N56_03120 [Cetobacterium sp. 2A]|uniref:hypothetical protein n=1 Tax=Cetobacterium sp. 2A TaxID=2754723 RepID=UPI00163C4C7B|nr:hypothetical protein [Cetobacterium sp. 2A]MBC2855486.1 hypothetical protein [Cetobacterium sp. 2A]
MIRTENLKAENTDHIITIEKNIQTEIVTIHFDFILEKDVTPIFLLPSWAKSKFETINLSGGTILLPDLVRNRSIEIEFKGFIRNHSELLFSTSYSNEYTGDFKYSCVANDKVGIIINGIRINSISTINNTTISTMLSIVRNHQGELISSSTFDSKRKRKFNIQTIPMTDNPYELKKGLIINSIDEFERSIYGNFVGEWIVICIHGKKYKTLLTGEVEEKLQKVHIDGKLKLGKSYSFTLEEV